MDGRRQHMPIVGVGQRDGFDKMLVIADVRVINLFIHQASGSFDLRARQVRPITQHGSCPFLLNAFRPEGAKQIALSETHQDVAEERRIERACI